MSKVAFFLTLLATVFVCLLPAIPAQAAGAARTFISAAGSDANNCTNVTTPCRHMAAAYAATAPNGEIYVLDPANYGSLTITGPVSIEGHGWASIAPVANSAAITINAPGATDKINIIGVVLDGTALVNTNGIVFNSGGSLTVRDSVIRNFSNDGIHFVPNSTVLSQLFVSSTLVSDNTGTGINIDPTGSGTTNGVLDHVQTENNAANGLIAQTSTQTITLAITDSVSANNGSDGIKSSSSGGSVYVVLRNCTIANNVAFGLEAENVNATIRLTRSTITGNGAAWGNLNGAAVTSYDDNNIIANFTQTAPSTIPYN